MTEPKSAVERLEALAREIARGEFSINRGPDNLTPASARESWYGELSAIIAEIKKRDEAVRKVAEEMDHAIPVKVSDVEGNLLPTSPRIKEWAARLREWKFLLTAASRSGRPGGERDL